MLAQYLSESRTAILPDSTKEAAFATLVELLCRDSPQLDRDVVLERVWERERSHSTRVTDRIAMPHAQLASVPCPMAAFGVCPKGIAYDVRSEEPVHLVALIIDPGEGHIEVLQAFAERLRDPALCDRLIRAPSPRAIHRLLLGWGGAQAPPRSKDARGASSSAVFRFGCRLAEELDARAILLHADALEDDALAREELPWHDVVVVTQGLHAQGELARRAREVVVVPFRGMTHHNQVEIALVTLLSAGAIGKDDRFVNVLGIPGSGELDAILLSDLGSEFRSFFDLPVQHGGDLDRKVLARTLQLAQELAIEGREGKPVGAIFVLGDHDRVRLHVQQMVMNPFRGYPESERSILDPSLGETLKEFSRIDGAFIVRGDGVIMSAGTFLVPSESPAPPLGLGARHAAAAAISNVTGAIAIAISESTKKISVFVRGERAMVL